MNQLTMHDHFFFFLNPPHIYQAATSSNLITRSPSMAAGYGEELLGRVSGLVVACTRRVSRATRRLLRRAHRDGQMRWRKHQTSSSTAAAGTVAAAALCARGAAIDKGRVSSSGEVAAALWSRRILMGERCQPLDFAGAIHYDSFGRRLARPPMPRSASSLSCRSFVRSPADADADADVSDSTADADVSDASSPAENDDIV